MKVEDLMNRKVISINDRLSIEEALQKMHEHGIRRLPVTVDGKLVGMIVEHDIEKAMRRPGVIPQTPVDWIMTKKVITANADEEITMAVKKLIKNKISGIPVVEGDKLIGIISETDILKAFIDLIKEASPASL
ncbi:MAG: CBS domain-containing protein [Syntrophomonadaceae bacterium]